MRLMKAGALAISAAVLLSGCMGTRPSAFYTENPGEPTVAVTATTEIPTTRTTNAPTTLPAELPDDQKTLYHTVRDAAEKNTASPSVMIDRQYSMKGDWGSMGFRAKGPRITRTDVINSKEWTRYYYSSVDYSYWHTPDSRYRYSDENSHTDICYCDNKWHYENVQGRKSKVKWTEGHSDPGRPRQSSPVTFPSAAVLSATVENGGGVHLIRMELDPMYVTVSLGELKDQYGDEGADTVVDPVKLEMMIDTNGIIKSQMVTITAHSHETFNLDNGSDKTEAVDYTDIYTTTYAPPGEKVVITPPDDLDTYPEVGEDAD